MIVANTTSALAAAQQATGTIPIVFNFVTDPVAQGFIASLSRPGGNSTGFGHWQPTMGGKWLEILKETAPLVTHVAAVFNPDTATYSGLFLPTMEAAAHSLAVTLTVSPIHNTAGMERAVAAVAAQPNGGLMLLPDAFTWSIRSQIVALAARYRLPAIYQYAHIAREGGLVAYGIDPLDVWRRTATYVDRILNGAKPADLPVQLPTKFELVINPKTAQWPCRGRLAQGPWLRRANLWRRVTSPARGAKPSWQKEPRKEAGLSLAGDRLIERCRTHAVMRPVRRECD